MWTVPARRWCPVAQQEDLSEVDQSDTNGLLTAKETGTLFSTGMILRPRSRAMWKTEIDWAWMP